MTETTSNSMNFIAQRNEKRINAKIPKRMKELIQEVSTKLNMSESGYIKLAIQERLEKDIT